MQREELGDGRGRGRGRRNRGGHLLEIDLPEGEATQSCFSGSLLTNMEVEGPWEKKKSRLLQRQPTMSELGIVRWTAWFQEGRVLKVESKV